MQGKQDTNFSSDYIKERISSDPDFIKKSKINYLSCNCKDLHEGEKLVLVCLENQCKDRGLICPVCKEENHKNHEVLHLKIFLAELQTKLFQKQIKQENVESPAEKNQGSKSKTLASYLNALDTAHKNIITNLEETVKILALSIKDIEKRIQQEYKRIRKVILSQKSFQNRLPKIYAALLGSSQIETQQNSQEIKQEIKKLTDLLQKNKKENKVEVASSVQSIVQAYTKNSDTCTAHLLSLITDLPKKFTELPIKMKNIPTIQESQIESEKIEYKFSDQLKGSSILLSSNQKGASLLDQNQIGGMTFLEGKNQENSQMRKVNLRIIGSASDSISLGVGDVEKAKQINFVAQGINSSYSELQFYGLYGICALGININDAESSSFVFSQGDVIEITYNWKESKLIFGRRNSIEKQEIQLGLNEEEGKKLKFFVSLPFFGDSVEIVE